MTAPPAPPSETPEPVPPERPRLIINGVPVKPEELGRNLSASVQLRLSISKEPYEEPEPRRRRPSRSGVSSFPAWALGAALVLLVLGVATLVFVLG